MAKKPKSHGQQLVPLEADWCVPSLTGTANCNEVCEVGTSSFFIKKTTPKLTAPHCEWFCGSLAQIAGVPTPNFAIVKNTEGIECFGSERVPGEVLDWYLLAISGRIDFMAFSPELSRIYAFDLFIHNTDRHTNNYLVCESNGAHRIYAFDHERSWVNNKFPLSGIMTSPTISTIFNKNVFNQQFPGWLDTAEMERVLLAIRAISRDRIISIIDGHPKQWLRAAMKTAIIKWWGTGQATKRVDTILKGIKDGTLI